MVGKTVNEKMTEQKTAKFATDEAIYMFGSAGLEIYEGQGEERCVLLAFGTA